MPRADYVCDGCNIKFPDVVFGMSVGATASAPACTRCGLPTRPIPFANFDLKTDGDGGRGFQKFDIWRQTPQKDGTLVQQRETIDSLHKLRRIEADSEQRYRNGEGEPMRFRGYANNASNMDRNSFGDAGRIGDRTYDSGAQPQRKQNVQVARHGQAKPKIPVGPGLSRRGATPLKG